MTTTDFEVVGENLTNMLQACFAKLPEKQMDEFCQLKTDKERVQFALKTDFVHEIMAAEPEEIPGKDAVLAQKFREEGNTFFQKKSYVSAIDCYNKCLRFSPPSGGEDAEKVSQVALAIGNRSAALFHLRRYEACLHDIQLAFSEGYPEEMHYKLYDRQGKCKANLYQPEEAKNSFNLAMAALEKAKLDEKARNTWIQQLNKQMTACEKITKSPSKSKTKKAPGLTGGHKNETIPNASGLIELKHSSESGRYFSAKENIRIGDVLASELPFSQVLMPDFYETHCYHCLKRVALTLIPDTKVTNVMYCSSECRKLAWNQYFSKEHRFMSLLKEEWCGKIGHLALRTVLKMGFCKFFHFMIRTAPEDENADPLTLGFHGDVYATDFQAVYNMETNIKRRLPEGLWDFAVYSIFLVKILQKMGYFDEVSATKITEETRDCEEILLVASGLMRLLQVIQCNAIGIVELLYPSNFEDSGATDTGFGLYTTACLFNHSCDPNAEFIFYGNRLIARATRNIAKGESVNVAYKVTYYKNVIKQRKGYLQSRYCFDCQCEACKKEWRHWRELEHEIPFFKCTSCGKELPLGSEMVDKTHIRCKNKKCNNLQDMHEMVGKMQFTHDIYAAAMQEAMAGHYEAALPGLIDHMILMQSSILPPFRDLAACQAAITQCFRMEGNTAV